MCPRPSGPGRAPGRRIRWICFPAARGVMGPDEGDAAPVPPDRRKGAAGGERPAQPLVERSLPPDRERHHHPAQRPAPRRHRVHRRLHHPASPRVGARRAPGVVPPDGPVGRRHLPRVHRHAGPPGHQRASRAPVPLRPARRRTAVRRGRRTRRLRSGRREPLPDGPHPGHADSGEVRGFWFGDEPSYPEPAFYSHTAPEPDGLQRQPLEPAAARWTESKGGRRTSRPSTAAEAPKALSSSPDRSTARPRSAATCAIRTAT